MEEKPILEVGGVTTGGLGHATMYGRIRLFADRLEFDKRTQHVVIPISQISGVATEGLISRKIKIYSRAGELVEIESPYMTRAHFDQLSEALRRVSGGEALAPGQLQRERDEAAAEAIADGAAQAAWGVVNAFKLVRRLGKRVFSDLDERAKKRSDDKEP